MTVEYHPQAIDMLRKRKQAYELTLGPPGTAGYEFLVDILRFCRVWEYSNINGKRIGRWDKDARLHALLEGRAQVGERILQHLHLQADDLAALYRAVTIGEPE